jgi:hypothetical protein
MMPGVSNGVAHVRVLEESKKDETQRGTISWRKTGKESHAKQDVIVCSKIQWREAVKENAALLAWATVGLRAGLIVAISPLRSPETLDMIAKIVSKV